MWVPKQVVNTFTAHAGVARSLISTLLSEIALLRSEKEGLLTQLSASKANFDWLRVRVNSLELERAQLLRKSFGIDLPVPEIARESPKPPPYPHIEALFEDMGDAEAKKQGLPVYGEMK